MMKKIRFRFIDNLQVSVTVSGKAIIVSLFLGLFTSPSSIASFQTEVLQPNSLAQTPPTPQPSSTSPTPQPSPTPKPSPTAPIPVISPTPQPSPTSPIPVPSRETKIPLDNDPLIGQWRSLDSALPPRDFIFHSGGKLTVVYQYSSGVITREGQYRVSQGTNYPRAIDLILGDNRTIQTIFEITDEGKSGKFLRIELKGVGYGVSRPREITQQRERKFQKTDGTGLAN